MALSHPLPVVNPSAPSHDRGPQAAPPTLVWATKCPLHPPTVRSHRRVALGRKYSGRGLARSGVERSGIPPGRAARRSALDRVGWPLRWGQREDATTRGAAAPLVRRPERWGAGPVPAHDASSATGMTRVAPPTPPCGRTAGTRGSTDGPGTRHSPPGLGPAILRPGGTGALAGRRRRAPRRAVDPLAL